MKTKISAIINGHGEKTLAIRSLKNFFECCKKVEGEKSVQVEKIAVLDRADELTREIFLRYQSEFDHIVEVDYGDLGLSRNKGVAVSSGKYVAFLDADDLWGISWLSIAFETAEEKYQGKPVVLHPERNIYFGARYNIWDHKSSHEKNSDYLGILLFANLWTALNFTTRSLLVEFPYESSSINSGFGYEDWHWNCEVLGKGIAHEIAPGTRHFVRVKSDGLLNSHRRFNATVKSNELFADPKNFQIKLEAFLEAEAQVKSMDFDSFLNFDDLSEMKYWSRLEQELFPSSDRINRFSCYTPCPRLGSRVYAEVLQILKKYGEVTHFLVVPWLKRGGAELATFLHAEAILNESSLNKVCIIATEDSDSPWQERTPEGALFVPFGQIASMLSDEERKQVLLRILLQIKSAVIHVIQSRAGWELIKDYGRALATHSKLFTSIYLDAVSSEGERFGYARSFLELTHDYLTGIYCDNQRYIDEICLEFGYTKEKFKVLYHPLGQDIPKVNGHRLEKPLFLWASRLDMQKRPDILVKIARENPSIEIHAYGDNVLTSAGELSIFLGTTPANLLFMGKYDSLSGILKAQPYSGFIYTSDSDGLPNVLIEIGASGIPIVAPDIGGIRELVKNDTGYLVSNNEDVFAYSQAIRSILSELNIAQEKANRCFEIIQRRHSKKSFSDALRASRYFGGVNC